jgi:hypothetical protein
MAAGLLDEPVDLAETQSRTLSRLFGREKRFEGALDNLLAHSRTSIGHSDLDILSGPDVATLSAIDFVEVGIAGFYGQFAPFRHGIPGVQPEIENNGLEFGEIGLDRPHASAADDFERDVFA